MQGTKPIQVYRESQGIRNSSMQKCEGLSLPYLADGSDVKNAWDLRKNKKILPKTIIKIPTVG
jgi:hypothetical protein